MVATLLLLVLLVLEAPSRHTAYGFLLAAAKNSLSVRRQHSLSSSSSSSRLHAAAPLDELVVTDTVEGDGNNEVAAFGNLVTVKYAGYLLNDHDEDDAKTKFDESMITFKLGYGKVLEGCDKGIRGMRVGGTRSLQIPSRLGFGPAVFEGPTYTIPPDSDLEYVVELTAIASGPMAEAAANLGIGLDPNTMYLK